MILEHIVLTQYNLKQGIKQFGDSGKAAVLREIRQFHDRSVATPVNKADLSPFERKNVLRYLMFLKKKNDGSIKGRGCADGRTQQN